MITAADIQEIRDNDPGAVLPGINTMTGNPYATSSLLDVSKITQNYKSALLLLPIHQQRVCHSKWYRTQWHKFWRRYCLS